MDDCKHPVTFHGLCGVCGRALEEKGSHRIVLTHDASVKATMEEAQRVETALHRVMREKRKLSLVLDLDHTLLHATADPRAYELLSDPSIKEFYNFRIPSSPMLHYVKMRPGLANFLAETNKLFECHIYTMGSRDYAKQIAEIIDPMGRYFGHRIISRDDCSDMNFKNVKRLFPVDDSMVMIIDDRLDVWGSCKNVIRIEPFVFFSGMMEVNELPRDKAGKGANAPPAIDRKTLYREDALKDNHLNHLLAILKDVHYRFFQLSDRKQDADVKKIMYDIRGKVLSGVHATFTRVFPIGIDPRKSPIWKLAEAFGAKCHENLDKEVTHLVSMYLGTQKVVDAQKRNQLLASAPTPPPDVGGPVKIVHLEWLVNCFKSWVRDDEDRYPVLPEPTPPSAPSATPSSSSSSSSSANAQTDKESHSLSADDTDSNVEKHTPQIVPPTPVMQAQDYERFVSRFYLAYADGYHQPSSTPATTTTTTTAQPQPVTKEPSYSSSTTSSSTIDDLGEGDDREMLFDDHKGHHDEDDDLREDSEDEDESEDEDDEDDDDGDEESTKYGSKKRKKSFSKSKRRKYMGDGKAEIAALLKARRDKHKKAKTSPSTKSKNNNNNIPLIKSDELELAALLESELSDM